MNWKSPYLLLTLAACFWGINPVFAKAIVGDIPPITLAFFRWLVAAIVFLPFMIKPVWNNRKHFLKHWKTVLFIALTGVTIYNTLIYYAITKTSALNTSVMNSITPIFILILSILFLKERLSWFKTWGIFISFVGVLIIITKSSLQVLLNLEFNIGDIWLIIAMFFWAVYSVILKKHSGLFDPKQLLAVGMMISVPLLGLSSLFEVSVLNQPVDFHWGSVGVILFIGIFPSIISFLFWSSSVAKIGPSTSGAFLNLIPLFSAVIAPYLIDERIYMYHIIGAVLIISGVYLATKATDHSARKIVQAKS